MNLESHEQELCMKASLSARSIEEIMLTFNDVIELDVDQLNDVICRSETIIECARMLLSKRPSPSRMAALKLIEAIENHYSDSPEFDALVSEAKELLSYEDC